MLLATQDYTACDRIKYDFLFTSRSTKLQLQLQFFMVLINEAESHV